MLIEGQWLPVPREKVLNRSDNPTGRAVVCWTRILGILCFIRGRKCDCAGPCCSRPYGGRPKFLEIASNVYSSYITGHHI